jgi:hypothetical protein
MQWWGCMVTVFQGAAMYGVDGARVWELTYDAMPALGVDESETHLVSPPCMTHPLPF